MVSVLESKSSESHVDVSQAICPDLRPYWKLSRLEGDADVVLQTLDGQYYYKLSKLEGFVLQHFVGQFTMAQIQRRCKREFQDDVPSDYVFSFIKKLVGLGIISGIVGIPKTDQLIQSTVKSANQWQLKPEIQWIKTEDGHWILRNLEDFTFMQLPETARSIVEALGNSSPGVVAQRYGLEAVEVRSLLQQLALTGMVVGTHPPEPPKGKFKPTQLLFFKFVLCNPDAWLTWTYPKISWIWSRPTAFCVAFFLALCAVIGIAQSQSIVYTGMNLWQAMGPGVFLPFGMLAMLVVTLHELGHAYTLKHYDGIVPEVGLMFMCLMPAAYTNTTDQYALPRRSQRILVVASGVLCQCIIAGIAGVLWNISVSGSWLAATSYLLLVAALFTVALNLNPLARFDGYYLLIALTGVNNLRSRSFQFYRCKLTGHSSQEPASIRWILALYAPFSFAYILMVFGHLFLWGGQWFILNVPFLGLGLLLIWAIYYFLVPAQTD